MTACEGTFTGSQQVFKLSITARSESQVLLGVNVHIERATSSLFQAEKERIWVKIPTIQSLGAAKIGTRKIGLDFTWGTFSDLRSGFLGPEVMQGYLRHHPLSSIVVIKITISIFITIIEVKHIYTFTDHPSHSWSSVVTSWLIRPALSPAMQERDLWENFDVSLNVLVCFKEFWVLICPGRIQPVKNSRFLLRKRTVA